MEAKLLSGDGANVATLAHATVKTKPDVAMVRAGLDHLRGNPSDPVRDAPVCFHRWRPTHQHLGARRHGRCRHTVADTRWMDP